MRTKAVLFFLLLLPVYVVNGQDDKREYLKGTDIQADTKDKINCRL